MKSYQRWWRWTVLAAGVLGTILAAMLMPRGTILAVAGGTAVVGALLGFGVHPARPRRRPQGTGWAPSARSLAAAAGLTAARYVADTRYTSGAEGRTNG